MHDSQIPKFSACGGQSIFLLTKRYDFDQSVKKYRPLGRRKFWGTKNLTYAQNQKNNTASNTSDLGALLEYSKHSLGNDLAYYAECTWISWMTW